MSNLKGLETERKFLILLPNGEALAAFGGAYFYDIEQVYLARNAEGVRPRIRKRQAKNGVIECFYTVKKKLTDLTRIENEYKITLCEYERLKREGGEMSAAISKRRWCLPYEGHTVEVDIYPFWKKYAIAEVELSSEDEKFELPDVISVVREVTGEEKYLNSNMAYELKASGSLPEE